jgi:hypothetical protein
VSREKYKMSLHLIWCRIRLFHGFSITHNAQHARQRITWDVRILDWQIEWPGFIAQLLLLLLLLLDTSTVDLAPSEKPEQRNRVASTASCIQLLQLAVLVFNRYVEKRLMNPLLAPATRVRFTVTYLQLLFHDFQCVTLRHCTYRRIKAFI